MGAWWKSCVRTSHATAVLALFCGLSEAFANCAGDCNGNLRVDVGELVVGVQIALGNRPLSACGGFDLDKDGHVNINELTTGVKSALYGCTGSDVSLVRDIAIGTVPASSSPTSFVAAGDLVFFVASTAETGRELWRTDGTALGTTLVRDLRLGAQGSSPKQLTAVHDRLYFTANDDGRARNLWVTDGSKSGTQRLLDSSLDVDGEPTNLVAFGGSLFFNAVTPATGAELWTSDGSREGTRLFLDIVPGQDSSEPSFFHLFGDRLYFRASTPATGFELWSTDGSPRGTRILREIEPGPTTGFGGSPYTTVGDQFYFHVGDQLWVSDGTADQTRLVEQFDYFRSADTSAFGGSLFFAARRGRDGLWTSDGIRTDFVADASSIGFLTTAPSGVFFTRVTIGSFSPRNQLWVSDGTPGGTREVRRFAMESDDGDILGFETLGDFVYFGANDGESGLELWRSDGSESGTELVKDIERGAASSRPRALATIDDRLFLAADGGGGSEPWISDGSEIGTRVLRNLASDVAGSTPSNLVTLNDKLFFTAITPEQGSEVWVSDGTPEGTQIVKDVNPGPTGSGLRRVLPTHRPLVVAGAGVYFIADSGTGVPEIWVTDGTADGTRLVMEIPGGFGGATKRLLGTLGTQLLFSACTPMFGADLWISDGSEEGTGLIVDVDPGSSAAANCPRYPGPDKLTTAGGRAFFTTTDFGGLYVTDGSTSGSGLLAGGNEIRPVWSLAPLGDELIFSAQARDDGGLGPDLWRSDGTVDGTRPVAVINPGPKWAVAQDLTPFLEQVVFHAVDDAHGREPWISDGTAAGTFLLADIVSGDGSSNPTGFHVFGNRVLFTAEDPEHGRELWISDATAEGTTLVQDILPGSSGSNPGVVAVLGDRVLFSADDQQHGRELWVSDGTPSGTRLIADINPGPQGSFLAGFTRVGDRVAFQACEPVAGCEPWVSDGRESGTFRVADVLAGPLSSNPTDFTRLGDRLFFTASTPALGRELWAIQLSRLVVAP